MFLGIHTFIPTASFILTPLTFTLLVFCKSCHSLVVASCPTKKSGWLSAVLSSSLFIPLARLCLNTTSQSRSRQARAEATFFRRLRHDIDSSRAQDLAAQADVVGDGACGGHGAAAVPWLQRTGIEAHLRGLSKEEIAASYALPPGHRARTAGRTRRRHTPPRQASSRAGGG